MPPQHGVAPNQPSTLASSQVGWLWALFFTILVGVQIWGSWMAPGSEAYSGSLRHHVDGTDKVKVTPTFELGAGLNNVAIDLNVPAVNNSWFEIQFELVNEKTGDSQAFEHGVEYYSGYDSDGYWSEGSPRRRKVISSVPPGSYHLNIESQADPVFGINADVI